MYLGFVGATTSNASGQINVFIDDFRAHRRQPSVVVRRLGLRSRRHTGVRHGDAQSRTGNWSINNPTGTTYNIASYSLASAGGSLLAAGWDSIAVGGNPPSPRRILGDDVRRRRACCPKRRRRPSTAPSSSPRPARSTSANCRTRTPIQDVQITLNLTNGSSITVAPRTPAPRSPTATSMPRAINIADFALLKANMHSNTSALTSRSPQRATCRRTAHQRDRLHRLPRDLRSANGVGSFRNGQCDSRTFSWPLRRWGSECCGVPHRRRVSAR